MIVILEGPDGSGKTTLARHLATRFGLTYHHEGPPPIEVPPLVHYGTVLNDARGNPNGVVLDRLALGERVYGPVVRQKDRLGENGWRVFQRLVRASGAIQVLCLPSYDVCYRSWASGREELFSKKEQFTITYNSYVNFSDETNQDLIYDYTDGEDQLKRLVTTIEAIARRRADERLATGGRIRRTMVGSRTASVLFVGEQGNGGYGGKLDLPFFSDEGSSWYLTRAIDEAGYDEKEIAFINAFPWDDHNSMNEIPQLPHVVALGARAARACHVQGVQHRPAPHPQYWKRFHYHTIKDYAQRIKVTR